LSRRLYEWGEVPRAASCVVGGGKRYKRGKRCAKIGEYHTRKKYFVRVKPFRKKKKRNFWGKILSWGRPGSTHKFLKKRGGGERRNRV